MNLLTHTLPITLQQARKARRVSQLELSMRLLVSQRHVSFVESGRAKPSRELLMAWLQALGCAIGRAQRCDAASGLRASLYRLAAGRPCLGAG
jgi:transcriptional regulator with XRE-family HTH domain